MTQIDIYSKSWCPYCAHAKSQLAKQGLPFVEIDVTTDQVREAEMIQRANRTSVPQIFFGDVHVGGSDDLDAVINSGELDRLIEASTKTELTS